MENTNTSENSRDNNNRDKQDKEEKLKEVTRRRLADTIRFNPRLLYILTLPQSDFQQVVNSILGHVTVWEEQQKEKEKTKNINNNKSKGEENKST